MAKVKEIPARGENEFVPDATRRQPAFRRPFSFLFFSSVYRCILYTVYRPETENLNPSARHHGAEFREPRTSGTAENDAHKVQRSGGQKKTRKNR